MLRALAFLAVLASGVVFSPEAAGQSRFSKPLALPQDRVLESATGRFSVHVPEGWEAGLPTGEMLQGEFLFSHVADSTYFSPSWVPHEWASDVPPEALAEVMLDQMVFAMSGEGDPEAEDWFDIQPRRSREVSGYPFTWQSIREVYPEVPEAAGPVMHFGVVEATGGIVLIIALTPPNADVAGWEGMVSHLRILPTPQ
ncbi:hypothetical protein [Rubricoccus marinus]|uniref:PsbP C-terminal domain-containing protein n=1 Tax=Rubricoccus marinus TaxID=716817 RepID=A0A259TX14_9BACT|nr:hypothetical protein [Rubricoccus marinus]OZC02305.1 hypothetical protein BSZ36_04525 [Rubricoccus marinus]